MTDPISTPSSKLLVGTRKGLFVFERDSSGNWQVERDHFLGDPVPLVFPEVGSERILAAMDLGHFGSKLRRSEDGGVSFTEVEVPAYPEKPEGMVDQCPWREIDLPWTTKLLWSFAQGPDGVLWAGTIPGGVFQSKDFGDSWTMVRSLWDDERRRRWTGGGYDFAGVHSIVIDPRDPKQVTLGVSVGGVWKTADAGASWELVGEGQRAAYNPPEQEFELVSQDPHCIVACPSKPERMWMQHHCGIFRSDDAGRTWTELKDVAPSSFGFAVAVHPTDPDTAWFVPAQKDEHRIPVDAKVVVTRTRDGGQSFEVLDKGLPSPAYDLTFRHALDVDGSGERLAFGSTTGSLWLSEDQGDSWKALHAHLPPVLCVRFVR